MSETVGLDNIYIFGLKTEEVNELWHSGYNSTEFYNNNQKLKKVIDALKRGFNGESFAMIADYLLTNNRMADPYMCMADFNDYQTARARLEKDYKNKELWAKKALINISGAGRFAADRAIREYANDIWKLKVIK